jgi:hypothetical protein
MKTDKSLHIMADNKHHYWPIAGGLFGFKNNFNDNIVNFMLNFSKNKKNNNYAIDCTIAEKFFFKSDNYIQHYSAGKKLDNSRPFPTHEPIDSYFVGCIININKYYNKLNIEEKYKNYFNIKLVNGDIFYYTPWKTKCIIEWYNNVDFILKPINAINNDCRNFKTENGNGILLTKRNNITVLWDNKFNRTAFMDTDDIITVVHDDKEYYFTRVIA